MRERFCLRRCSSERALAEGAEHAQEPVPPTGAAHLLSAIAVAGIAPCLPAPLLEWVQIGYRA